MQLQGRSSVLATLEVQRRHIVDKTHRSVGQLRRVIAAMVGRELSQQGWSGEEGKIQLQIAVESSPASGILEMSFQDPVILCRSSV